MPAGQVGEQRERPGFFANLFNTAVRMMLIYYAIRYFTGSQKSVTNTVQDPETGEFYKQQLTKYESMWKFGNAAELFVYIGKEPTFNLNDDDFDLVMHEENIRFGKMDDKRNKTIQIPVDDYLANNGSLYAHVFLTKSSEDLDYQMRHNSDDLLYHRQILTKYLPRKKASEKKNLLSDSSNDEQAAEKALNEPQEVEIISYWWPNMTINLVAEQGPIPVVGNPHFMRRMDLQLTRDVRLASSKDKYLPIFWNNDFWMLQEHLMPINNTLKNLNLTIDFCHVPSWKFQLYVQFTESFRIQTDVMGVAQGETDEIKRMLIETNPILLGVTFAVSLLHSVFDFLAFKNDIQFWREKKDMEGLSFRSIMLNVFFQLVIFLYLLDNETSWMVIVSSGVGLLIEIWKIRKTVVVKFSPQFPFVHFVDKVKPSAKVTETQKYDQIAFKYLSYLLYPLLAGYTIYSLVYEQHKSWYSFIIGTLVGFVYMFGFITMTPQLYINYRLKSVANMPWKTFMYKALNTFVDDLFAFVVKMPTLHRLACLRDDVIFVIYLYQRWIYPEDKTRMNEFGQVGEAVAVAKDEDKETEKEEDTETKKEK